MRRCKQDFCADLLPLLVTYSPPSANDFSHQLYENRNVAQIGAPTGGGYFARFEGKISVADRLSFTCQWPHQGKNQSDSTFL